MKKIYAAIAKQRRGNAFEIFFFKAVFAFLFTTAFMLAFNDAGAQIARRGSTTVGSKAGGTSTTFTIKKPSGVVAGDVMIFVYSVMRSAATPAIDGWKVARQKYYPRYDYPNPDQPWLGVVMYKVAGQDEPATYSFTVEAQITSVGAMMAFSGVDVTGPTPFDSSALQNIEVENQMHAYAYPITTQTPNAAVVMLVMNQGGLSYSSWQTDSIGALAEIADSHIINGLDQLSVGAAWATKAQPGSTGAARNNMNAINVAAGLLLPLKCIPPPPVITSFSPASGAVGSSVTITGTGFFADTSQYTVYFDTAKATVTAATLTGITVTVPRGATTGKITVTDTRYNRTVYTASPFVITFDGAIAFNARAKVYQGSPVGITAADIDGDGLDDLVSPAGGSVVVLPNSSANGGLAFNSPVVLTVASSCAVAVKDIDGDGKADLVVANKGQNNVSVFKNTSQPGNISFAAKQDFTVGLGPLMVAVADIDGDGKADIVTANASANTVSVLRNTSGSGVVSFATKADYSTGTQPYWVRLGDIDGNGKTDIVVANFGSDNISVIRNGSTPGSLSFASMANFATGFLPRSLALADIDGDGKLDISVANYNSGTMSVFRNTSPLNSITMAARADYAAPGLPTSVSIRDVDGDGKLDIAVTCEASNTVSVYKNNSTSGALNIAAASNFATPASPEDVIISDINNDGKPDIAVTDINVGNISVLTQVCNTPVITSVLPAQASPGSTVTISGSNFSNSGTVSYGGIAMAVTSWSKTSIQATLPANVFGGNIVVANECFSSGGVSYTIPPKITSFSPASGAVGSSVTITGNNFNATPAQNVVFFGATKAVVTAASTTSLTVTVPAGANYQLISVTNLGGNVTAYSQQPFVVTQNGAGTFKPKLGFTTGTLPFAALSGDFDVDGKPDVAVVNLGSASLSVFHNTTTGNTIQFDNKTDFALNGNPADVATADLDGDGKPDIAATTINGLANGGDITLLRNTSTGAGNIGFAGAYLLSGYFDTTYAIAINDMDGDGKPDIALVNRRMNVLSIYRNTSVPGTLSFDTRIDMSGGSGTRSIKLNDIDGDGKPDIILSTDAQVFQVFLNRSAPGAINVAPKVSITTGQGSYALSIGDIDGDGKPDVAVANETGNTLSVHLNKSTQGAVSFATRVDYTLDGKPQGITMGDVDGDGKVDIAVTSSTGNMMAVFRNTSTTGAVNLTKTNIATDATPRGIVFGDLNGDNMPDLAVINYSANTLSVFQQDCVGSADMPTLNASSITNCGTQNTTLSIASGNLNNAANWQWYTGSCGGINIASGTSINITPAVTTTYYARGEGGCMAAGQCASITITVNTPTTWYRDADNDGFGNPLDTLKACSAPAGYVTNSLDCDDTKLLYADNDGDGFGAGLPAACGVANNTDCNDNDASVPSVYYADNDHDGFGDLNNTITACTSTPPDGYVTNSSDCDDTKLMFADNDGDGYGAGQPVACGVANNSDCNDNNASAGAPIVYYIDVDKDGFGNPYSRAITCSPVPPDGFLRNSLDCDDNKVLYADNDGDGYGAGLPIPCGGVANNTDFDDTDPNVHEQFSDTTAEICSSGLPYHWNGNDYYGAGTYHRVFINGRGDVGVATLVLTVKAGPTAASLAANNALACFDDKRGIVVTAAGGVKPYLYSIDGGSNWQTSKTFSVPAGTYSAMVKDTGGCTLTTNSATITQPDVKLAVSSTVESNNTIIVIAAGGYRGYMYGLNSGAYQASNLLTGYHAGADTIFVKDSVGCIAKKIVNTFTVTAAAENNDTVVCAGQKRKILATVKGGKAPFLFSLNGVNYQTSRIFAVEAGSYSITVKDSNNNIFTAPAVIITTPGAAPAILTSKHNVSCFGGNDGSITVIPADGTSNYSYRIGTGNFTNNNVFTGLIAGKYPITALDMYGCMVTKGVIVPEPVTPCSSLTSGNDNPTSGTAEMKGVLIVKVLPNPAQVVFNLQVVSGDSKQVVELRVMDMTGKVVYHTRGSVFDTYSFGRTFAGGIYIAEVLNGGNVQRIKLVKGN